MTNETWRTIPRYPNYEINDNFDFRHKQKLKIKNFYLNDGYLKTNVHYLGKRYHPYLHQLIAWVFIPNPENKPELHHIDEDKLNNHWSNLQWVTRKEHKAISKINEQTAHKISVREVVSIRNNYSFENEKDLAKKYNVSRATIYSIAIHNSRCDIKEGMVNELKDIYKKIINIDTGQVFKNSDTLGKLIGIKTKELRRRLSGERYNTTPFRYIVDGVIKTDVKTPPIKPKKEGKVKFVRPPKKEYTPHPKATKKLMMFDLSGRLVNTFESTREASKHFNANHETFRKAIKLSSKGYYKGFIFKYE